MNQQKNCATCKNNNESDLKICTHCRKVYYCSLQCQKKDWKTHKTIRESTNDTIKASITDKELQHMHKIFKQQYVNVYKIIYGLNQTDSDHFKSRNTYYYQKHLNQHKHKQHQNHKQIGCCGKFNAKIYIPQIQLMPLEKIVKQVLNNIKNNFQDFLQYAAATFFKIKQNGIKSGQKWNQEAQKYVFNQVLNNASTNYIINKVKQISMQKQKIQSKQPMLFATAATWYQRYPNIPLNFLDQQLFKNLYQKDFGICKNMFQLINIQNFRKQIEYYEKDGHFDELISEAKIRNDRIYWIQLIKKQNNPQLFQFLTIMYSIPFQINTKTHLSCMVSESVQISYFKVNGFHKRHRDSDIKQDTGKKFSLLYALDPIKINLYRNGNQDCEQLILKTGELLILKSRIIDYELNCKQSKTFLIRYWINGPLQIKQNV